MRMTGASCGQYAGLRDVDVTFGPGLNVIVGPNESGKSSLLSLVSNVLCRPGKVGRSKAEDKEFRHAAFPAPFRDGAPSGDAIDGRVAFDAGDGEASIVRRWGPKGGSELRTARGDTLTDEGTIRAELEGALTWGAGVWQELLLAPKGGASLRALFETPSQSRSAKDLEAAAARAFAEAGAGPTISAMEQALRERLADVEGKWDAEQGRPVRKGDGKRWARGAGEVVEAWYALEDARGELAKAEELAKELEAASARLEGAEAALSEAEAALEAHRGSMGRLEEARRQRAELEALREDLAEAERALEGWPAWQEAAGRIEASCEELSWAVAVERARRLEELDRAIAEAERVRAHAPSQEDVDAAREAGGSTRELEALRKEMEEADRALEGWPLWEEAVRRVEALREELSRAVAVERALRLEELEAAMGDLERVRAHAPSQEDVDAAREAERDAREIEARLGGMSVAATVRMEGGHEIVARSSLTGEEISVVDGRIAIDGAVTLRIDGVMEMELAPAGVDVMAVRRELDDRRAVLGASLARWGVGSVEELAGRAREGAEAEREMERLGAQREALSGGDEEDAPLEAGLEAGPARERDAIEAELRELCGADAPEAALATVRERIGQAARTFGSMEDLAERVEAMRRRMEELSALVSAADLPEGDVDLARREEELAQALSSRRRERDGAIAARASTGALLLDRTDGRELEEDVRRAEGSFERARVKAARWRRIWEAFERTKGELDAPPMRALARAFAERLGRVTDGRLDAEATDGGVAIYGSDRALGHDRLSEGTKGAVALAFRLAVADALWPEGGGVLALDDPLTDMDEDRAARAMEMIRDAAGRHQILFLTCSEARAAELGGSVVRM